MTLLRNKVPMNKYFTAVQRLFISLCLVSLLLSAIVVAQIQSAHLSPDKFIQYYQNLRAGNVRTATEIFGNTARSHKCGFGVTAQLLNQWKNFTSLQKQQIKAVIQQTVAQCDTVIGHFHIYYDTAGTNTPALLDANNARIPGTAKLFVDSVGAIFNHVWDVEIGQLGFSAPPFETGQSSYNIFISELSGQSIYGQTNFVDTLAVQPIRCTTNIDIDNDFAEFATKGLAALKVTAAHEFHHAIQLGSYGYWEDELYPYEMTSTWMESYVYPAIKDYYNYLSWFFSGFRAGLPLYDVAHYDGYERIVWAQFLVKRLGVDIMKDTWIHMSTERYIESVRDAIVHHGSTLSDEFAQFAYWNYFTADRADTTKSYSNGYDYPRYSPLQSIVYSGYNSSLSANVEPLSVTMHNFIVNSDTVTAVMVNDNIEAALQRSTTDQSVKITLSSSSLYTPYQILSNGLYAGYSADHNDVWRTFYLQSTTHSDIPSTNLAALPNPFNMEEANRLVLPVPNEADAVATVSFVSSSLNSVFDRQFNTSMEFGKRSIAVPTSLLKSKLSSGIYFVIATVNGNEYKWKVAVIK